MLELIHAKHSVHRIGLHIVWCTKYRHHVLKAGIDIVVKQTIGEACSAYGWKCHALEVMSDHVHLFVQIKHTDSAADVAKTLKSLTALAVFHRFPKLKGSKFWGSGLWSDGTYYGSVGSVSQDTVRRYIDEQKAKT